MNQETQTSSAFDSMFSWNPSRDADTEDETDFDDLVLEMEKVELELRLVQLKRKIRKRLLFTPPDR